MHEILPYLRTGEYVLDLGCGRKGSFDPQRYPFVTVRADIDCFPGGGNSVRADAARLPFRDGAFDAVICNHGLEHFENLDRALLELGRIAKRTAAVYLSVPDAGSLTDRVYRWLGRGGGHVNGFRSARRLSRRVETRTGLHHRGTRTLFTSLSFLNCKNRVAPAPRKQLLLGGGNENVLILLNYFFRMCDRLLGTRSAVYGWAMYFGQVPGAIDREPWVNVCVRCGSGHKEASLAEAGRVRRRYLAFPAWVCPTCSAINLLTPDKSLSAMQ